MLFKISFIYSIDTDFYSKLQKCKTVKQVHDVTVAERDNRTVKYLLFLQSQVFKFSMCKDLKANTKILPQSLDWAASVFTE